MFWVPAATLLTLKSTPKANSRPPGIKSQPNLTTARVKGQKVSLKKSWVDILSRFLMDFPWKWTYFESSWGHIWPSRGHRNPKNDPWYQISNHSQHFMCERPKSKSMETVKFTFCPVLYQFPRKTTLFWVSVEWYFTPQKPQKGPFMTPGTKKEKILCHSISKLAQTWNTSSIPKENAFKPHF